MIQAAWPLRTGRQVAVSHFAGALAGAAATVLGPILPVLARMWLLSDAQSGALLAWEFTGGFCGAIACGWLGARRSLASLLAAGLFLLAAGFGGAALLRQTWIPLCLFSCGLGMGFVNPSASLIVARARTTSAAAALNLFGFSWATGALATPYAVAYLLRHEPVSWVFRELAILAALAAVLVTVWRGADGRAEAVYRSGKSLRHGPVIASTAMLLFLYVGTETSVSVWLPMGAARLAGASEAEAAVAQSIFWGALLAGRLLAPVWLRRLSPRRLLIIGLLAGAGGIAFFVTTVGYRNFIAGAGIAGFALAPVNAIVVAAFTMRLGGEAARWTGPVFAAGALGGAVLPWMVGALSSQLGNLRAGFAAPLAGIAAMLFLAAWQAQKPKSLPESPPDRDF